MIEDETGGESLTAHNQIRGSDRRQRERRSGREEGHACTVIPRAARIGCFAVLMMGCAVLHGGIRTGSRIVMPERAKCARHFRHGAQRHQNEEQHQ